MIVSDVNIQALPHLNTKPKKNISKKDRLAIHQGASILAARKDVNAFISYCFLEGRPQHKFHADWHKLIEKHDYLVLFAPLEHGKTEQISAWRSIWLLGNNPDLRIWICSAGGKLAFKVIGQVQEIILTNDKIKRVFPNLVPEDREGRYQAWNSNSLIVRRTLNAKDPSMQGTGIMGSSIGSRVDVFVGDDMMNFKNTFFDAPRERSIEWFRSAECMGRIAPGGKCVLINNPWHDKALAHVVVDQYDFKAKTYKACDEKLNNILWPTEESIGRVVGFNKKRLEQKRRVMGTVEFARCYLGQPITDHTEFFDITKMTQNIWPGLKPHDPLTNGMMPICGIDPAVSKKHKSAETAFFLGGVNLKTGIKQLRSIHHARMSALKILQHMVRIYRQEPNVTFIVESNGQQDYLIQIASNIEIVKMCGAEEPEARQIAASIRPFWTDQRVRDPDVGIAKMSSDFEAKVWRVPECPEVETWFKQALAFHPGAHTGDILMASWLFWTEANRLSIRRPQVNRTVKEFIRDRLGNIKSETSGLMEEVF